MWTPPPRGIEGTLPGRISRMRNVGTPSESEPMTRPGKPTVRKAEISGGNRTAQQANAGASKDDRKIGQHGVTSTGSRSNWPDTGPGARARKGADVGRVSLWGACDR